MHRRHRRELYNKLVPVLSMLGLDGKACILRALCEAGQRPRGSKGSFAEELLHSVFTLPQSKLEIDSEEEDEEDMTEFDNAHKTKRKCAEMFPSCSSSFVELTAF
ncbi:uncharacterized protein [Periplaneta americana]|uniref:uncharacterized protein n=1 Tax=Periplaneta americana TaxID=6978 RepID=UPI0037E747D9